MGEDGAWVGISAYLRYFGVLYLVHMFDDCVNNWIDTNVYAVGIKIGRTEYSSSFSLHR